MTTVKGRRRSLKMEKCCCEIIQNMAKIRSESISLSTSGLVFSVRNIKKNAFEIHYRTSSSCTKMISLYISVQKAIKSAASYTVTALFFFTLVIIWMLLTSLPWSQPPLPPPSSYSTALWRLQTCCVCVFVWDLTCFLTHVCGQVRRAGTEVVVAVGQQGGERVHPVRLLHHRHFVGLLKTHDGTHLVQIKPAHGGYIMDDLCGGWNWGMKTFFF